MDPIFIIELVIVALVIAVQAYVFVRNGQSISALRRLFPRPTLLATQPAKVKQGETEAEIDLIADQRGFSATFRDIMRATNAYLTKNRGAAHFDVLKEIATRKVSAQERSIEANVPLPLYLGLLCTFTGVIIGLVKISIVGVSDAAIQSFIGGVLIGMVGSAAGLAFTTRSNFNFREAKQDLDREEDEYFTFLRTDILPALRQQPSESPLNALRDNLAAFNEQFVAYQGHVNESLGESLRLFQELKDVFGQLRSLEQGVNGIGHFLKANDGLIEKQVAYLDAYAHKAENYTRKLGQHFQTVDQQVESLVAENIRALEKSTQAAYVKMDQYLSTLDGSDRKAFAQALTKDLDGIRGDLGNLQAKSVHINEQLLQQLSQEQASRAELTEQVRAMSARLEQAVSHRSGDFVNSLAFKVFAFAGTAAFLAVMAGTVAYVAGVL
jgi:gas vesicle protein